MDYVGYIFMVVIYVLGIWTAFTKVIEFTYRIGEKYRNRHADKDPLTQLEREQDEMSRASRDLTLAEAQIRRLNKQVEADEGKYLQTALDNRESPIAIRYLEELRVRLEDALQLELRWKAIAESEVEICGNDVDPGGHAHFSEELKRINPRIDLLSSKIGWIDEALKEAVKQ